MIDRKCNIKNGIGNGRIDTYCTIRASLEQLQGSLSMLEEHTSTLTLLIQPSTLRKAAKLVQRRFSKTNATAGEGTYAEVQSIARPREVAARRRSMLECMMKYRVIFGRCALRREGCKNEFKYLEMI